MKRNLLKILPFLLLGGVLGLAAAPAAFEAAETKAEDSNVVEVSGSVFDGQGDSPSGKNCSYKTNGVTISTSNGYGTGGRLRIYANKTLNITSTDYKISKVELTMPDSSYVGLNTVYDNIDSTSFSATTTKQTRISNFKITLSTEGVVLSSLSVDTSKATTTFTKGQTLDLTGVKINGNKVGGGSVDVTSKCTFSPASGTKLDEVGSTTINVTYAGTNTPATETGEDLTTSYDVTISEGPAQVVYTKITSNSALASGNKVILVDTAKKNAAKTGLKAADNAAKHYLDIAPVTIDGNNATFDPDSEVCVFTLETGKIANTFALKNENNKYLAPYSTSAEGLKYVDSINDAASWTLNVEHASNLTIKTNLASATNNYLVVSTSDFRLKPSSTGNTRIDIFKYSSGNERVTLDALTKDVYEGHPSTIKATAVEFSATSWVWESSNTDAVDITSGGDTSTVTITGKSEGSSNLTVTANGKYKATCVVTCKSAGSLVIEPGDYIVTDYTNTHQLVKGAEDMDAYPDFTDIDKAWNFEFAGLGDGTYYVSNGGDYLIHDQDKGSDLGVTSVKDEYWTITKNADGETYTLISSGSGNTMVCDKKNTGIWFAFNTYSGNVAKINLSKTGTLDSIDVTHAPTNTKYFVGDSFDIRGLVVDATFSNGKHANIADKVVWDPLVKGTEATGKVTLGGVTLDVTVPNLKIFGPKDGGLVTEGIKSQYYIGENILNSIGDVKVTYECGTETEVKILKKEEYVVTPNIIEEGTTSIRVSMAKDASVFTDYTVEAVKNHFVATNYIGTGDIISIGTLGYDPYEIKGGKEFTYDGTNFGYADYGYMPNATQQFEVAKVDGYYTLKNTANHLYLRGDSSSFKAYSHLEEQKVYKDGTGAYKFNMTVDIAGGTYEVPLKSAPNPADLTVYNAIEGYLYVGTGEVRAYSDLANDKILFYYFGKDGSMDEKDIELTWRVDGGAFVYLRKDATVTDPINDEALWSLTYDDYSEAWQMTCKAYPTKQCYWNKDGKFGFYTIGSYDGSQYFNIMLFRDNTKPLQGALTGVSVSFQEGMDVVSQGEPFPWTSALIVTAYYSGGAFKQVPIGGYQVELPDTSKIGKATGKVIFGQEGHEVEKEFTITVKGHTQAFNIKGDRDPVLVGEECQLRVEPAAPEGEPIKWSVDHPEFASISETGLLKGIAPGYINVTATSFDGVYSDTVKIQIYQQVESVTLDKHEVELNAGETSQLTATVKPDNASNKNVEYSSSNPSVAFVDAKTGLITAVSKGTATITCAAQNHPEENFDTCVVTVKAGEIVHVTKVELDCTEKTLEKGSTFTLKAIITPENATVKGVTWSTNHDNIATVDQTGKVKGIANGQCEITARTADGGLTAKCTVTVKTTVDPVHVESVTLDTTSKKIDVGDEFVINATVKPSNADKKNVSWSTLDNDIIELRNMTGSSVTVVGLKEGTATITATCDGKSATCKVTVGEEPPVPPTPTPVVSVTLDKGSLTLDVGGEDTLVATVHPENADNIAVSWSSSDESIAKVDQNGKVTAIAEGQATITVTTNDGGKTDTCLVTVNKVEETPEQEKHDVSEDIAIVAGVGGTVAVAGVGCGVGIPLGLRAKKRKLHK